MDANTKYTLIVFNTCTQKYEEVAVTEEVYRTYCRTGWNIKDNDLSFFDHEIQLSGMIGSQDGAYENFREFVDSVNTPENIVLSQIEKEALYQAISALPTKSRSLVQSLFDTNHGLASQWRLRMSRPGPVKPGRIGTPIMAGGVRAK